MSREGVDIHGTDHSKLPQVVGLGPEFAGDRVYGATIYLNFVPSPAQLDSLRDHLRSWTPPDA